MIFWILFAILILCVAGIVVCLVFGIIGDGEIFIGVPILLVVAIFPTLFVTVTWHNHAADLAKVEAQHYRVAVYQERVDSLDQRLSEAQYPGKPTVSLDADTPWATMMQSLNNAETELARAKDQRASAILSIIARKRGPMSGVVTLVGDIDESYYTAP